MPYIARKCVNFDREYQIGEIIPDEAVSPQRATALQNMGLIVCIDVEITESPIATDKEVADTVNDIFDGQPS